VGLWRSLGDEAASRSKTARAASSPEAAQLLEDVEALLAESGEDGEVSRRLANLLLDVSVVAYPPDRAGPFVAEARAAQELAAKLVDLRYRIVKTAERLVGESLEELDGRLRAILRQARLVQIDAAVGKKKKLEIEIANLAAGKFPADLFYTLRTEGVLGDDEEYWPFEGEHWSDEYVNFK
jgi:hypothetical protein